MTRKVIGRVGALALADEPRQLVLHGVGGVAGDLAADAGGDHLEDARSDLVERRQDGGQLGLGCEGAGDGVAPDVAVPGRAAGREAEGARLHAGAHDGADRVEVGVGGVLERALTHDVGPDGGVGDVGPDIEGELPAGERVEILREALPRPPDALGQGAAGDVLDALHQLDQLGVPVGPHRGEADPAVAQDGRRDAVPARRGEVVVPGHLAVEVGVDVDEAGCHQQAVGVDHPAGAAVDGADLGDEAGCDGHVGGAGGRTAAVDDRASPDHEVVHGAPPKAKSSRSTTSVASRYHPAGCGSWVTTSPAAFWK